MVYMYLHITCVKFDLYILKHIVVKNLSQFLKEKRKENNFTQEEFAECAGIALTVCNQ